MNIDKAIEHAFEVSTTCENASCALEHMQLAFWLKQLKELQSILGYSYNLDRLKELADADKEGRCLILPCKIGTPVYEVAWHIGCAAFDDESYKYISPTKFSLDMVDEFGKTIFLTKEDAERAVKKKKK